LSDVYCRLPVADCLFPTHRLDLQSQSIGDRAELIPTEVVLQHPAHLVEVAVVADFVNSIDRRDPWLVRVELPRVEVHHEGVFEFAVPFVDGFVQQRVRNLTEPVAAGDGHSTAEDVPRRRRDFPDRSGESVVLMDEPAMGLASE